MSAPKDWRAGFSPRALQGFVWWWWVGAAWGLALLWCLGVAWEQHRQLAVLQDARLVARAQQLPEPVALEALPSALGAGLAPGATPAPGAAPQGHWWQLSRLGGEIVAGAPALEPYAQGAQALAQAPQGQFFLTHAQGVLAQALAQPRQARAAGTLEPLVWTVAEPWGLRWPSLQAWAAAPTVRWALATALAVNLWALLGHGVLGAWLRRTQRALLATDLAQDRACAAVPLELQPALERLHALQQQQDQWVQQQRRFLADASHELRTPMAVLRTQLQSALAGHVPVHELLPQMLHTVDRAAGLANRLLSLSRLEQLQQSGGLAPVDLRQCAHDTVVELAPLIAAKRLDFALDGPALGVPGDAAMLGELLRNLLANAIHHTPAGGRLGILLRASVGAVELLVWDDGPGLDDSLRPRLFQPYSASPGGVGLGLSICQQIAQAMGARVQLFNRCDRGRTVGVDALVRWPHAGTDDPSSSPQKKGPL
ncbi:MAG: sensor histidine kinase [Rhodoferax sp.]